MDFVLPADSMGFVCRTSARLSKISPETFCVGEPESTSPVSCSKEVPHTRFAGQKNNLYNGKG